MTLPEELQLHLVKYVIAILFFTIISGFLPRLLHIIKNDKGKQKFLARMLVALIFLIVMTPILIKYIHSDFIVAMMFTAAVLAGDLVALMLEMGMRIFKKLYGRIEVVIEAFMLGKSEEKETTIDTCALCRKPIEKSEE